jgi:holo-[acyl-carrier protein] synthase
MILGLGVDIVEIDRMAAAIERRPRILERCFSEEEREYAASRNRPEVHYALRFAAKEAVLKALGTGFSGMRFTDVQVARDERGRPVPKLSGRAAEVADELGVVEMHLSLSFTHNTAVASAVAMGASASTTDETEETARDRFSATFKQMRGVLDELPKEDDPQGDASDRDGPSPEGEACEGP